jgi:hypothetical protein
VRARQAERDARAAKLTTARKQAAGPFAEAVMKELADLAMTATRFSVAIEPRLASARGADHVEFLLSPNPGEPLKPLAKIASGGEISRVMLAMKSVLSRIVSVPTLVFDEVDTGIGGRTGSVLGDKLARLGAHVQVLCITHLPQIAARGAAHLYIEKRVQDARTIVQVACLDDDARVWELARMLGGGDTETVVQHAREMLAARPDGADEADEIRGAANRAAASVPPLLCRRPIGETDRSEKRQRRQRRWRAGHLRACPNRCFPQWPRSHRSRGIGTGAQTRFPAAQVRSLFRCRLLWFLPATSPAARRAQHAVLQPNTSVASRVSESGNQAQFLMETCLLLRVRAACLLHDGSHGRKRGKRKARGGALSRSEPGGGGRRFVFDRDQARVAEALAAAAARRADSK